MKESNDYQDILSTEDCVLDAFENPVDKKFKEYSEETSEYKPKTFFGAWAWHKCKEMK